MTVASVATLGSTVTQLESSTNTSADPYAAWNCMASKLSIWLALPDAFANGAASSRANWITAAPRPPGVSSFWVHQYEAGIVSNHGLMARSQTTSFQSLFCAKSSALAAGSPCTEVLSCCTNGIST